MRAVPRSASETPLSHPPEAPGRCRPTRLSRIRDEWLRSDHLSDDRRSGKSLRQCPRDAQSLRRSGCRGATVDALGLCDHSWARGDCTSVSGQRRGHWDGGKLPTRDGRSAGHVPVRPP